MANYPYIIFDFETGGTNHHKNPVCEFAAIAIDSGSLKELGRMECIIAPYNDLIESIKIKSGLEEHKLISKLLVKLLINNKEGFKEFYYELEENMLSGNMNNDFNYPHDIPGDLIYLINYYKNTPAPDVPEDKLIYEQKAFEVNGLSLDIVKKDGIQLKEFVNKFTDFCKSVKFGKGHNSKPVLIAHNAKFDIGFIHQIINITKQESKFKTVLEGKEDYYGNWQPDYLDTIRLARQLWANESDSYSYNLSECCNRAGIQIMNAHRAMADVEATKDLFVFLINKLRRNGSNKEEYKRTIKLEY